MKRDLTTLSGAAFAVGDASIQIDFIADGLLSRQMEWGEAESLFELLRLIAKDLQDVNEAIGLLDGPKREIIGAEIVPVDKPL